MTSRTPNNRLRYERELRGWSQSKVAGGIGTNTDRISRWESGESAVSPYYREKLCLLFHKNALELGLLAEARSGGAANPSKKEGSPGENNAAQPPIPNSSSSQEKNFPQDALLSASSRASMSTADASAHVISSKESQFSLPSSMLSMASMAPIDCGIWFSEKVVRIVGIVNQWRGRAVLCVDLQKILDLELQMFDEINSLFDPDEYRLSRRNALIVIAALPKSLLGLVQQSQKVWQIQEEFLPACTASLNACWQLMNGREIAAVEHSVAQYLPILITWARQPSPYQQTAANLASQGCLLLSLVSLHLFPSPKNYQGRLAYCKQAVEYARVSQSPAQLAIALIHLGGSFYDYDSAYRRYTNTEQLTEMLHANQEAVLQSNNSEVSPLLRSKALAELARAYSRFNEVQDSFRYIQEARAILPEQIGSLPSNLPDSGLFHHIFLEGQTLVNLGTLNPEKKYNEQAWEALEQIEHLPSTIIVPERFRIGAINQRAFTSVRVGRLDQFCTFIVEGASGAKALNSEARRQEVIANWKEARKMWPQESRVLQLADLLV